MLKHVASALLALIVFTGPANSNDGTTQCIIDQLIARGYTLPSNFSLKYGWCPAGVPGRAFFGANGKWNIRISFLNTIFAYWPAGVPHQNGQHFGTLAYVIALHEYAHLKEDTCPPGTFDIPGPGTPPYNTTPPECGEIQLQADVLSEYCSEIGNLPYIERFDVCDSYNAMKDRFNEKTPEVWNKKCAGTGNGNYPGAAPDCPFCP